MGKFCTNCGSKLNGNEKFCINCGQEVTNSNNNQNIGNDGNVVTYSISDSSKLNGTTKSSCTSRANTAFVLSLVGFFVVGVTMGIIGIVGISMGISAKSEMESLGIEEGKKKAKAAIIIGIFDVVIALLIVCARYLVR